jgi:hypothetical protein
MIFPKISLLSLVLLIGGLELSAQVRAVNRDKYRINMLHTTEAITIDGVLDEKSWQLSEKAEDFTRVTPVDTGLAVAQTYVVVTYDKSNVYIGAVCYDPTPGETAGRIAQERF